MAIVEASSVVLANDSAVLHMAIGFDRPSVGLYGPTDQSLVGPYVNEREPPAVSRVEVLQHLRDGDELDHKDQEHGEEMMRRIGTREVVEAVDRVVSGQLSRGDARNHA
jgi:ADP-heptose:LPS heptosyltransferase